MILSVVISVLTMIPLFGGERRTDFNLEDVGKPSVYYWYL